MNLGTHEERMQALGKAFDDAQGAAEQIAIVQAAARLDRETISVSGTSGYAQGQFAQRNAN